jgi:hypothetical protein
MKLTRFLSKLPYILVGTAIAIGFSLTAGDVENKKAGLPTEIVGKDEINNYNKVSTTVRSDGLNALVTDASVVVTSTFGADQSPDSYFKIIHTGNTGDTLKIDIAATTSDPSSPPDRDAPAFSKTFTVLVTEQYDEIKFRDRIIQELNADSTFRNSCLLKAAKATDRGVVHIYSEAFSLTGEFWERPNSGDFAVTVTGATNVFVGFDNLISRSKPVSIARDVDSPHRLGVFGVFGSVTVTAKELADLFVEDATNVTYGSDMLQDGSSTPIYFRIEASTTTDLFIEMLIFDMQGNGIKFGQFGARPGGDLTNCIEIKIQSDNVPTTFPLLCNTEDFKNKWAALSGDGSNFRIDVQAGKDEMLAILHFENPFIMRVDGTFTTDDFIQIKVQDDIDSGNTRFNFRAKGFEKEP